MEKFTVDFQKELFKFLIQSKANTRLVENISRDIFTFDIHKTLLDLLKHFVSTYSRLPKQIDFLQFATDSSKKKKYTPKQVQDLHKEIKTLFSPLQADEEYLSNHIIELVKKQLMTKLLVKYSPLLDQGSEVYEKMYIEFEHIIGLSVDEKDYKPIPTSIFTDWDNDGKALSKAFPCFLNGLNGLTSQKGFATPELIGILGLPKSFKTGTMLNLAVDYALQGLNVFIADFENGQRQIRTRVKQTLLKTHLEDVVKLSSEEVGDSLRIWTNMGGSIWVGSYTAYVHSTRDVEADMKDIIQRENLEGGFNCIVWDYADVMAPTVKQSETRLAINKVYHDIIAAHRRHECFGFTSSHTNRSAINKFEPDMSDFSEDWAKAKNLHGCFYISQDEETEAPANIARIGVVMQRLGVKQGHFYVHLDYERQTIKEIPQEVWEEQLEE